MKTVRGYQLREGISQAAHKIASTLVLDEVSIRWENVPTASIDSYGRIVLPDVKDDAFIPYKLFVRYLAYTIHELLHRRYTKFELPYSCLYHRMLTNALEDARIENTAIAAELTGNIGAVLGQMIDQMAEEGLDKVDDWADPRQLPFVLAVHCRNHATIRLPMQPRVRRIFDQAKVRLNTCANTEDVAALAQWVLDQLEALSEPPGEEPGDEPGDKPTDPGEEPGDPGDGDQDGDQPGDQPTDKPGDKPGDQSGGGDLPDRPINVNPNDAVDPEPDLKCDKGNRGGVSWNDQKIAKDQHHVDLKSQPRWSVTL